MKRKVRTISVNNQKFVWWYGISEHVTTVNISPFHDKTSVISINFPDISMCFNWGECNESNIVSLQRQDIPQMYLGNYNENVVISKDDTQDCVKIVEPKMAGLLISYFIEKDLFVTRKTTVLNGYDVLSQMGYQIVEVKKGLYW